jgi:16S rRNA processing protein RimM
VTVSVTRSTPSSRREPTPPYDHVIVGRVVGAWGIRGEIRVHPATDVPDRFSPGNAVYLNGRLSRIERSRTSKGTVIVKLDVVGDRTDAEGMREQFLTVPRESLQRLPPGSYYHFHIIDMEVYSEHEERLGKVTQILPTGGRDVYVVSGGSGEEVLIPAVEDYIIEVDVQANRMTVRLPEGAR